MSQIVRDTGLTAADAWALADDRSTWRALRPTAGYAQQWVSKWVCFPVSQERTGSLCHTGPYRPTSSSSCHHSVIDLDRFICVLVCIQQEASEARYVATMKTVRQVKTVFIIFIAFVCCWSPYVLVLLYDSTDSLPLSVHLITSMLAHLHASLNFAIYSLSNKSFRAAYRQLGERIMARCCRRPLRTSYDSTVIYSHYTRATERTTMKESGCFRINKTYVTADECYQLKG